ncbi:WAS/WASL-interacting protein family member 1-like [Cynocephalus volans]|uniref:WAS/WASL-interacting protein family member 1-like n=1 Tax=Cynocephalus volans TaxID=110931 RepID=UPI002FCB5742
MGFQYGNIISEPTDKVPSGAHRITEEGRSQGKERGCCGQPTVPRWVPRAGSAPSLRLGVGPRELPREAEGFHRHGRWESALGQETPSWAALGARSRTGPGGAAAERNGTGRWGRGSRVPLRALRASVWPAGVRGLEARGEHGVRPRRWQPVRARRRMVAGAEGPPLVGPKGCAWPCGAGPPTPSIPGRRARPQPGPRLTGDPPLPLPQRPAPGLGVPPSHLPAERRSPQPSECNAPLAGDLPPPAADRRSPTPRSPRPGPRPLTAFTAAPGHAPPPPPPGGSNFASLGASFLWPHHDPCPAHPSKLANETTRPG